MHDMWILLRRPLRGLATAREVHRRGRQSEQSDDLCTDVAYRYRARLIEARTSRLCHGRLKLTGCGKKRKSRSLTVSWRHEQSHVVGLRWPLSPFSMFRG